MLFAYMENIFYENEIIKISNNDFYKELKETQIFHTFENKIKKNKNNFPLFISMLKNIKEKYFININKKKNKRKKKIKKK